MVDYRYYNPRNYNNDIAMLTLCDPIVFNEVMLLHLDIKLHKDIKSQISNVIKGT